MINDLLTWSFASSLPLAPPHHLHPPEKKIGDIWFQKKTSATVSFFGQLPRFLCQQICPDLVSLFDSSFKQHSNNRGPNSPQQTNQKTHCQHQNKLHKIPRSSLASGFSPWSSSLRPFSFFFRGGAPSPHSIREWKIAEQKSSHLQDLKKTWHLMASPNFYKKTTDHRSSQCKVDFKWMESMVESVFQNQGRQSSASEEYLVHVAQRVSMSRKHVAEFASEWPKSSFTSFLQKITTKQRQRTSDCTKKTKVQICSNQGGVIEAKCNLCI